MDTLLAALVEAGILTQADAERIERQLDPVAARDFAENLLAQAIHAGLSAQQRRILDLVDATDGYPSDSQLTRLWDEEDALLWQTLQDPLHTIALERAILATLSDPDGDTWRRVNEAVLAWVDEYYLDADGDHYGSIPNLNLTSRTQFALAFRDWQRGELEAYGAVDGLPQLIRALTPIFGPSRAKVIAATEVTRIFAESERTASLINPFVVHLQWLTAHDELVCPLCGPRANRVVGKLDNGFRVLTDDFVGFPPAHPNCRCSVTPLTGPAYAALQEQGMVA